MFLEDDEKSLESIPEAWDDYWDNTWPCFCCTPLGQLCLCGVVGMDPEPEKPKEKSKMERMLNKLRYLVRLCFT
jgi:hypothetical protein